MELSATASLETVHKVYRILAPQQHLDNAETGSTKAFKKPMDAYQTQSDVEERAAFDGTRGVRQHGF